jgi:hypothetical protein
MQARFDFYHEMHLRVLEAAGGLIDFTHIGEDLGNQRGPMISKDIFERHFAGKFEQYFDMAHSYGARTMMHMCDSVCVQTTLAFGTAAEVAVPRFGGGWSCFRRAACSSAPPMRSEE